MNLFWLKYVSWALLGGAVFFYYAIRLNRLALPRVTKAILFSACIALACIAWRTQERNTELHSPRQLVIGTVISVTPHRQKGGNIDDSFRLQLESRLTSQEFTTEYVTDSEAKQPIHTGDLLGVLYRTWDGAPLTIDEIQGQQPGWHYHIFTNEFSVFIWTTSITGIFALIGALGASRIQAGRSSSTDSKLNLNN